VVLAAAVSANTPVAQWDDAALVEACLAGDERAWDALIEKYKRLIYGVLMRYRMPEEDAADIFQAVCVDLYTELGKLREVGALRGWLARVAANKCFHWRRRGISRPEEWLDEQAHTAPAEADAAWLQTVEREQLVQQGIGRLSARCQELVRMLFFEDPPRPYDEVARQLGLATGSIGFIRSRCLAKLSTALEEVGL
jgi:RNA polymerase sigma factor (sigma-70 family)